MQWQASCLGLLIKTRRPAFSRWVRLLIPVNVKTSSRFGIGMFQSCYAKKIYLRKSWSSIFRFTSPSTQRSWAQRISNSVIKSCVGNLKTSGYTSILAVKIYRAPASSSNFTHCRTCRILCSMRSLELFAPKSGQLS